MSDTAVKEGDVVVENVAPIATTTTSTTETTTTEPTTTTEQHDVGAEMLKAVPDLTEGLLLMSKIPLDAITMKLLELQKEQCTILSLMNNENQKLQSVKSIEIITENFKKVSEYLLKIQAMKKEMNIAQERMTKMKKRATTIKEKKQQHILNLNERVEKALQKERDLTVKPSPQLQQQQQQQQQSSQQTKPKQALNTNVIL
eukprot:gene6258-7258_t